MCILVFVVFLFSFFNEQNTRDEKQNNIDAKKKVYNEILFSS